jgi:hypothetical protein
MKCFSMEQQQKKTNLYFKAKMVSINKKRKKRSSSSFNFLFFVNFKIRFYKFQNYIQGCDSMLKNEKKTVERLCRGVILILILILSKVN